MNDFLIVSANKSVDTSHFLYTTKSDNLLFCTNSKNNIHKSKNFITLFYGELFNKHTLLSLLKNGDTATNASIISQLFEKYTHKCFKLIEGNFSILIYEKKKKNIYAAVDITGSRPLYYSSAGNLFLASNSLKNILLTKVIKKEIDPDSLALYFKYGFILRPKCIYKKCKKVPAGFFFVHNLQTNKVLTSSYWSLTECYNNPKTDSTEEKITENAKKLLINSIKKRVPKNGTIGAFLSGGYDSATICALLKKELDIPLQTFTIGFEKESINEAAFAKKVATYLGVKHTEYYFKDSDAKKIILSLSDIYEQPFADYGASPTIMLAQIAKQEGVSTLFGGDGGDEIFATADDAETIEKIMSTPHILKNSLFYIMNNIPLSMIKNIKYYNPSITRYEKFLSLLRAKDIAQIIKLRMTLFTDNALSQLLDINFSKTQKNFEDIKFGRYAQTIDQITGVYFKTFLNDAEIIKSANALEFYDISMKSPFLDKDLITYMATVPAHIKIKNKTRKNILKNITHSYIPKELMDRPKMGFDIPFEKWLRYELYDLMMDLTTEKCIKQGGILNHKEVTNIKERFLNGDERYKYKLWTIFIFQLWHNRNFG